jgi:hypothetical protein
MKAKLDRLTNKLIELRDQAHDDEFIDEIDNALIHLEAASDRLVAIEEDEDDDGSDNCLTAAEREAAIDFANQLLEDCE